MKFANIHGAHFLWIIVFLVMFYAWAFKKRKKVMESFARKELLEKLTQSFDIRKRNIKVFIIVLAVFLGFFAFMRPQWGFQWEEVKRRGLDILVAIDTSKSMMAEDVKPNRLERSKLAVKDLIKKLRGDRIGLITFAGEAFLQCPLTVDYNGFMLSLDDLNVNTIPKGGTAIGRAIKEAIKSYEGGLKKYKILLLITDGEDHGGDLDKVVKEAKEEGIKIFCIGIGTKDGELIPFVNESGSKAFLKDKKGNFVKSRLDETELRKIAVATGGGYVRAAGTEFGLDLIYEEKLSKMEKREFEGKMRKHYDERFQIPLFLMLVLLVFESFIDEKKVSYD